MLADYGVSTTSWRSHYTSDFRDDVETMVAVKEKRLVDSVSWDALGDVVGSADGFEEAAVEKNTPASWESQAQADFDHKKTKLERYVEELRIKYKDTKAGFVPPKNLLKEPERKPVKVNAGEWLVYHGQL